MPPDNHSPKDALHFSSIDNFGHWPILLSARAQKDVKKADSYTFKMVLEKLEQLSKGQFSRGNKRSLIAPKMGVPIYRAKMAGDKRIIYRIDCISDPRYSYDGSSPYECQAIWIFGVFTIAELHRTRFWDTISRQFQQRGEDYVERCTIRNDPQLNAGDDVVSPSMFPPLPEPGPDAGEPSPFVSEDDIKEIHSLFVLDKFVMMSQAVLNSILTNEEIVYVPPLSTREREIVDHPNSCYVVGRSGTGKTTTMLLKMLATQRAWNQCPNLRPKPRQVFVTQSPVLKKKVKEYFAKLMSSPDTEKTSMTEKDVAQETEHSDEEDALIGHEYSARWGSDLPERFSGLLDEHFPLFVTYDQLCTMLENDLGLGGHSHINSGTPKRRWTTPATNLAASGIASSSDYMQQSRENFVSFSVFLASYWGRLPQTITRKLDSALVFREFMGVIKGSEDTAGMGNRSLNRESYKLLSHRGQATFSNSRDDIYDLFTIYNRFKDRKRDYDAADRTHQILEALHGGGQIGRKVDFLYVDEVQDHLLIDTLVLRKICANQHVLFWAGDTAQTISVGSSFRFADLKAYQHRIEKRLSYGLGITPVEPRTFELATNHRSHSGIVNCARSIVNLILRYWPHSIDALKPEHATTPGFRPIFAGQEDVDVEELFFTDSEGEGIDLGAKQCILVRNDTTKAMLEKRFPKLGNNNFMTLHESKGLEFNDVSYAFVQTDFITDKTKVILYNFFEDSLVTPNQWRLVLNGVSYEDCLQDAPIFDDMRHASVCVELKFLYVAITRARQNLCIVDNSRAAEPMKIYWRSKDQISIWSPTTKMRNLATQSTPEEWAATGKMFFFNERYAQALVAFRRAGRDREVNICNAYLLKEKAKLVSTTASAARVQAFAAAAKAFYACAKDSPPKHIKERRTCYEAAGDCYSSARDMKTAGNSYLLAELYAEAACAYQEGKFFEEMVNVITQHRNTFDDGIYEQFMNAARVHYFKRLNIKAALKLFPPPSEVKALEFLESSDLDDARIKLLLELGRILEAAAIHAKNGDMLKAVEMMSTSTTHRVDIVRRKVEYLLTGLRRGFTLGITPSTSSTISRLLVFADQLGKATMTDQESSEFAMYQAIRRADYAALRRLVGNLLRVENDPVALLCLDHVFSSPFNLRNLQLFEVQASLSLYLDYIRLLNKFRSDVPFTSSLSHQRLFGFRVLGENRGLVQKPSLLYDKLTSKSRSTGQSMDGHKCGFDQLRRGITAILESRIQDRTKIQNQACYNVHGFSPCMPFLVQEKCSLPNGSCTFQHITLEQLSVNWYHTRLRLILLQFQILELAHLYDFDMAHYWLRRLYSTLHPPSQKLGSLAKLAIAKIPETFAGLGVVRNWVRRICDELSGDPPEVDRFRQLFVVACTLAFDLGKNDAGQFTSRAPMYKSKRWPISPFRGTGNLIIQDFVAFLTAKDRDSLTLGLSYLRGVLGTQIPVDMNMLCDLVERLAGMYIMARKVDPQSRVLHEVALPRSWLINLTLSGTYLGKDTSHIPKFASTVIEFMQQINAQVQRYPTATTTTKERFIADGTRLTDLTGPLYIARICLCLCIIGYNVHDDNARKRVLAGIQSLRKGGQQLTPLAYRRYADANDWDDLVHAFTESLKHPSPDEMILLLHKNTPGRCEEWSEHVCPVTYSTLGGIPKLLLPKPPSAVRTGVTHAQQHQHVEWETEAQPDPAHGRQREPTPIEVVSDSKEAELDRSGSHREDLEVIRAKAAKVIQGAYRAHRAHRRHLERKRVSAARKIQAAYRLHLKRREVVRKGVDETKDKRQSETHLQQAVVDVKEVVETPDNLPGPSGTRSKIKKRLDQGWKWILEKKGSRSKGKKSKKNEARAGQ